MSTANPKRTRQDRVAALELPPGLFARILNLMRRPSVLLRLSLCLLAAATGILVTGAWAKPFAFRSGYIPPRNIVARSDFSVPDLDKTELRRRQSRAETVCVYEFDSQPLVEMREAFRERMFQIVRSEKLDDLGDKFWMDFEGEQSLEATQRKAWYDGLRAALSGDQVLEQLEQGLTRSLDSFERHGLLESLEHELEDGSQTSIFVHPKGNKEFLRRVEVEDVRIAKANGDLPEAFREGFVNTGFSDEQAAQLAVTADQWFRAKGLPVTLAIDQAASARARLDAERGTPEATIEYHIGDKLADGGAPLSVKNVDLLKVEHEALLLKTTTAQLVRHTLAAFGMYVAMFVLCGSYLYFHFPEMLLDLGKFCLMMLSAVATVTLCWFTAADQWRAEIIPLTMFGITIAIAYQRELALLLSTAIALVVALSLGQGLAEFVILVASVSVGVLLLTKVRSRTKLIYVGAWAGLVTMLTTMGVGTMVGQAFGLSNVATLPVSAGSWFPQASFATALFTGAAWFGFCSLLAGVLMTGLLPFIEKVFDVQTDLSLLELGDAAHPLLQELARRAPGTYNHSINVASLAESAAEAIGANGLLVRVGAYFHDIGKMLKANYFIENQGQDSSRHQSLVPAMSTLVIIAHVKDGADLARQHHLPQSIIDFIEQHHGTTLVEYFYIQASRQSEEQPENGEVDETSFRYPGPKPQTREAGVMMLADGVESASRTLTDPGPARIESLVNEILMKRLLDGQFEECGLTLQELHVIEDSLVKSLTAVYHGRVKYPDQQSA